MLGPYKLAVSLCWTVKRAQVLNQFFSSVFPHDDPSQHVLEVTRLPSNSVLTNIRFSALQVKQKLDNLKSGSAPGLDGLTTDFLKNNSAVMSVALSELYNMSLAEGRVPADWRLANVTPIFKKGSKVRPVITAQSLSPRSLAGSWRAASVMR